MASKKLTWNDLSKKQKIGIGILWGFVFLSFSAMFASCSHKENVEAKKAIMIDVPKIYGQTPATVTAIIGQPSKIEKEKFTIRYGEQRELKQTLPAERHIYSETGLKIFYIKDPLDNKYTAQRIGIEPTTNVRYTDRGKWLKTFNLNEYDHGCADFKVQKKIGTDFINQVYIIFEPLYK